MKREDIERYLERGDHFGFMKQTGSPDYLGWILLHKRKPHARYLSLLETDEEPEFVSQQERIRHRPYHVAILEIRREVLESERYEGPEDYGLSGHHDFSNLDEVEELARTFWYSLEDIRWASEINAP